MKIYLIPGLGYTKRIFEKISFGDLSVSFLDWLDPNPNESLSHYTKRLLVDVPENEEDIIVIGHSFGGIIAQEIAKAKRIKKVILLSSIKSSREMPLSFKMVHHLKLYRLFTREFSIKTVQFWGDAHGFQSKEDKALFKEMVSQQSNLYLQWALQNLSGWKESSIPQ
ncbi:MAG: alpha/beta hydrolase, partial [Saprospiraceae bacterium]|nr:alpha/beta hydrolase [Saprospiraceae bacterium]